MLDRAPSSQISRQSQPLASNRRSLRPYSEPPPSLYRTPEVRLRILWHVGRRADSSFSSTRAQASVRCLISRLAHRMVVRSIRARGSVDGRPFTFGRGGSAVSLLTGLAIGAKGTSLSIVARTTGLIRTPLPAGLQATAAAAVSYGKLFSRRHVSVRARVPPGIRVRGESVLIGF